MSVAIVTMIVTGQIEVDETVLWELGRAYVDVFNQCPTL